MTLSVIIALIGLACLLTAALVDIFRFEIPDSLSIVLLATAMLYGLATPGFGWLSHLAAPVIMFGVGLFIFSRGWMGGGDIKLLVALAAWTGLAGLPLQLVSIAIAGGALSLVLLVARGGLALFASSAGRLPETLPKVLRKDAPLPYAVAIAAGTLWWAAAAWPIH